MAREIPHDIEAERALLGAMLIDNDVVNRVLNQASLEDFYIDSNRFIFEAIAKVAAKGQGVDYATVNSYLSDHNLSDKTGGMEYLIALVDSLPTVAHTDYYLKILIEKSTLRKIIFQASQIVEESYEPVDDLDDFIMEVEKKLLEVTQSREAGDFKQIRGVVNNITERLNKLQSQSGGISGVATGFKDLDKITSGFQPGDLIILAARPAMGKTAFALNIAHQVAENSDLPVAIFSLEMPAEQLVQRIICSMGEIEGSLMRTGEVLKHDSMKYYGAAERVNKCNLYIDDSPGIRINDIISKCRKLNHEHHGLKLILIDYLQLIVGSTSSRESRQQEVSDISRQLKALAREMKCPVLSLSQLSRSVEQRENKRPMLSDLRESGAIEQDADIVSFIYREDYYRKIGDEDQDENNIAELIIAKHRNGSTGDVKLQFQKEFSRFNNLAQVDENGNPVIFNSLKDVRG